MKINNKSKFVLPAVLFLLYFFASGEDVSWIEIIGGSILFSAVATFIINLIYKIFTLLFHPH